MDIFQRGDKYYQRLYCHIRQEGETLYQQLVKPQTIKTWLIQRCQKDAPPALPKPTDEEMAFLYSICSAANYQQQGHQRPMIYESWSWVEHGLRQCSADQLTDISQQLSLWSDEASLSACLLATFESGELWIRPFAQHNLSLLNFENNNGNTALHHEQLEQAAIEKTSIDFQQFIGRHTRRIYAQSLLNEPRQWQAMQYNMAANLVFSPQEAEILHSTLQEERPFPLFINGRAGSGKSTILQHLFSEYLYFSSQQMSYNKAPIYPVYFTCNQTLTDRASDTIKQILQVRDTKKSWQALIKSVCMEFRGFLIDLIPQEQRCLFERNKWLDYGRFRMLWDKKFGHQPQAVKNYPASLCWHVIRSYIKGLSFDNYLELQEYQELGEEQRSVSDVLYQTIYENVWKKWYLPLCKNEGYWDDQDLARYVLEGNYVKPRFAAIFCDEAQDFTRIEVQIVLRLNLFSARHLYPDQIQRVPLVFAGDQFQTLNPTGFRWESIKAQVVEQFIFALDPAHHATLSDINYRELSYNFRSTQSIAQFSNIVHGLRAKLFALKSLLPQQSWQPSHNQRDVILIDTQDHTLSVQLAKQYDLVFVLPCLDGQETDYIQQDPILQQYLQLREDGSTSIPAMSVIRAKGLEFQRVVIYGFALDCPSNFDLSGQTAISSEQKIHHEYFLNRLYVAITRARNQLLIIDQSLAAQKFWQPFEQPWQTPLQLSQLPDAQNIWQTHLGSIRNATLADITPDADQILLMSENAQKIRLEGLENQDVYLLRQAAGLYQQLEDTLQQKYCLAEVLFIEESYQQAGLMFEQTHYYERAVLSYWRAQCWQNIYDLVANGLWLPSSNQDKLYADAVTIVLNSNSTAANYASLIYRLATQEELLSTHPSDKTAWQQIVEQLLSQLPLDSTSKKWNALYSHLNTLNLKTYFKGMIHPSILAEVAYLAKNMQDACNWWDKAQEQLKITPPFPRYAESVAVSRTFPENLEALAVLQRNDDMCQQFNDFSNLDKLSPTSWQLLLDVLFKEIQHITLAPIINYKLLSLHKLPLLDMLIETVEQQNASKKWLKKLKQLRVFRACTEGDWDYVVQTLNQEPETQETLSANTELVLYGLAHSELYSKMTLDDYLSQDATNILQALKRCLQRKAIKHNNKPSANGKGMQVSFETQFLWHTDLKNPRLIGAVLERSNSFNDALEFYELLEKNKAEADYAGRRWLACKLRQANGFYQQAQRLQAKLDVSTRIQERDELLKKLTDVERKAEQNQNIARRKARLLGLANYTDISDYPEVLTPEDIIKKILNITNEPVSITPKPPLDVTTITQKTEHNLEKKIPDSPDAPNLTDSSDNKCLQLVPPFNKNSLSKAVHALDIAITTPIALKTIDCKIDSKAAIASTVILATKDESTPLDSTILNNDVLKTTEPPVTITHDSVITTDNSKLTSSEEVKQEPTESTLPISNNEALHHNIALLPATRHSTTQLTILDYRIFVVRSQGRLNIEHQATGETVSIWPKTQLIKGDWLANKQQQQGLVHFQNTNLWLQFFEASNECVIFIPEHGLSLRLHCG
ncbi:MAG: hypothetical protein KDI39_07225 [Pseudomonadales bacterium]|nr:hypothetical protein [Pseudomonadales bacterium]